MSEFTTQGSTSRGTDLLGPFSISRDVLCLHAFRQFLSSRLFHRKGGSSVLSGVGVELGSACCPALPSVVGVDPCDGSDLFVALCAITINIRSLHALGRVNFVSAPSETGHGGLLILVRTAYMIAVQHHCVVSSRVLWASVTVVVSPSRLSVCVRQLPSIATLAFELYHKRASLQ
eukprot:6492384-Amphidinium_carterae.12